MSHTDEPKASMVIPGADADAVRKHYPLASGLFDYFPRALWAVAHVSYVGSQQHHPGQPLHWDRAKSPDEADALLRHFSARGTLDSDGVRHSAKVAWRALALLEKELEAPPPPRKGPEMDQTLAAQCQEPLVLYPGTAGTGLLVGPNLLATCWPS